MIKWKKGIYYVYVTGSGVNLYSKNDELETLAYFTSFDSYKSLLDFLKLHGIRYKLLQNKWDFQVI